jgi:NAD-dependent DNA ligase
LYYYKPAEIQNDSVKLQYSSLECNKKVYSAELFERAKKARNLFHALGHPSIPYMRAITWMNMIINNLITTKDIDLAEMIFGLDIRTIKGKTTRGKPIPVVDDIIDLSYELLQTSKKEYAHVLITYSMYIFPED